MRRLVPVLALAMLAGLFTSLGMPQRADAAVEDHVNATYNMQGGGAKWTTDIPQIINRGANVIALQEVGARPPGDLMWTSDYMGGAQNWHGWRVQGFRWRPLGQNRDWYIFYIRTDFSGAVGAFGGRVNIAILTRDYPSQLHVARPAFWDNRGLPTSRPALGITLGNTLYFSVHALSSGGNDGARLVENIAAIAGARIWAAMGDWNRSPDTLAIRRGWHRYTVGGPTHQAGGELDYMVSNERIVAYRGWTRGYGSDHFSVEFRRLAANAEVELLNTHDGFRHLTFQNSITGTRLISGPTNPDTYSGMEFRPAGSGMYTIVEGSTGKCWRDYAGGIVLTPCNGNSDQRFDMRYWDDTGQLVIKPMNRSTCVGDDPSFGWGSEILTTVSCNKGETRLNFRFDEDPGGNPAVVF
ncbi:endonuclease/exonuclease/phosphatase family protein [Streptomyces sp. NPDC012616]|uniref:endonuclease/exonuclease/phosphatase family protein n=1 Tax=Streptomyces sp. NPDC012616 TaxID=3364840 RepID=UPI0036E98B36